MRTGIALCSTPPYGVRRYGGNVRTQLHDEVRLIGSVYRVVQMTTRIKDGISTDVWEYISPTSYTDYGEATKAVFKARQDWLDTDAEERKNAAALQTARDRAYCLGIPEGTLVSRALGCDDDESCRARESLR